MSDYTEQDVRDAFERFKRASSSHCARLIIVLAIRNLTITGHRLDPAADVLAPDLVNDMHPSTSVLQWNWKEYFTPTEVAELAAMNHKCLLDECGSIGRLVTEPIEELADLNYAAFVDTLEWDTPQGWESRQDMVKLAELAGVRVKARDTAADIFHKLQRVTRFFLRRNGNWQETLPK